MKRLFYWLASFDAQHDQLVQSRDLCSAEERAAHYAEALELIRQREIVWATIELARTEVTRLVCRGLQDIEHLTGRGAAKQVESLASAIREVCERLFAAEGFDWSTLRTLLNAYDETWSQELPKPVYSEHLDEIKRECESFLWRSCSEKGVPPPLFHSDAKT